MLLNSALAALAALALASPFDDWVGRAKSSEGKDRALAYAQAVEAWAPPDDKKRLTEAYHQLGLTLLFVLGEPLEAASFCELGLKRDPGSAALYSVLGNAYLAAYRFDRGERAFRRFIQLEPASALGALNLANALLQKGDPTGAMGYLRGLCEEKELAEAKAGCLMNRSITLADLKRFEEARADLRLAESSVPTEMANEKVLGGGFRAMLQLARGYVSWREGDNAKALQEYDQAAQESPQFAMAAFRRGQALAASGKTEEALSEFNRALVLDKEHVPSLMARATLQERLGQKPQALQDYASACSKEHQPACAAAKRLKKARRR